MQAGCRTVLRHPSAAGRLRRDERACRNLNLPNAQQARLFNVCSLAWSVGAAFANNREARYRPQRSMCSARQETSELQVKLLYFGTDFDLCDGSLQQRTPPSCS